MLIALLLVFLLAMAAPFIHKKGSILVPVFFAAFTTGIFVYFLSFFEAVTNGETPFFTYTWSGAISVDLSFYLDGLSLFFALLISFIGILILLYSAHYMKEYKQANRFFGILIFFMGSMLGLVLSANIISLFIFWELTSFSSYLLIGFKHKDEKSRKAAHQAWLVTATGGLVLLAGFILLGLAGDSYTFTELLANKDMIRESPLLTAIIVLLLIGAFTKSAQFPFHFWLPNAMEAPTPVSAYLHSATMVKAGVYLVLRLNPLFADVFHWQMILTIIGGFTMLMGAIVAFRADDLKRVLAFSTISALGIFFMMVGIGSKEAIKAATVYVLAHALYKATLFLVAGILDHECETRKISKLSGIPKKMPFTNASAVLAALSMAGVIPFIGFTGKEILYKAAVHHSIFLHATLIALMVSSVFFVAVCIRVVWPVFFLKSAREGRAEEKVKEASGFMVAPPLVLGVLGLLFGLFPETGILSLLEVASGNISGTIISLDLSLWHGYNLVFLLSLLTIALGVGLYFAFQVFKSFFDKLPFSISKLPESGYEKGLHQLVAFAKFQTRVLQNGYLRNYISVYVVAFCLLILYYLFYSGFTYHAKVDLNMDNLKIFEVAVLALVLFTISFIFISRSRLGILASIGVTGYGIALLYALFSAPDVAITQFLAETLGLILLAIILPNLPRLKVTDKIVKMKYLLLSCAFGLLMAFITLVTMSYESDSRIKGYFLENSKSLGHGENVVNVILVDFRALDTLGEISVLIITMVGIIAFLAKGKEKREL